MKIIPCQQCTPEWWAARRGVPTASEFGSIIKSSESFEVWRDSPYGSELVSSHRKHDPAARAMAKYTHKDSEARVGDPVLLNTYRIVNNFADSEGQLTYICRLIADRFDPNYGQEEGYISAAMKNGTMLEPEARAWYELERGVTVKQVGFIMDDAGQFGYSPDGLIIDPTQQGVFGTLELKAPAPHTHVRWLIEGGLPDEHKAQVHGGMIVTGAQYADFMSHCPGFDPLLVRVEPDAFTEKLRSAMRGFWSLYQDTLNKLKLRQAA